LKFARSELHEYSEKISNLEFENYTLSQDCRGHAEKIEVYRIQVENLEKQKNVALKEADMYRNEYFTFKENY